MFIYLYFVSVDLQVFVANHTSMIDFIILEQMTAFAVIMQKHPGWVGKSHAILLKLKLLCFLFPFHVVCSAPNYLYSDTPKFEI